MEGLGEEEITVVEKVEKDNGTFEDTYKYRNYNYTVQGETKEKLRRNAEDVMKKIDEECASGMIYDLAFSDCSSLTQITIPSSVTGIGNYVFSGCSSLTQITIPSSVTEIGDNAFSGCSSLTQITIPDSVKSIGNSVFFDCRNLAQITIPRSVTSIGESAFYNCSSLTQITLPISFKSEGEKDLRSRLGLGDEVKITYLNENTQKLSIGQKVLKDTVNYEVQAYDTENAPRWKSVMKYVLCGIFGAVSIGLIVALFLSPGAQVLLIGPLLAMGVPKIAAIAATVAQFVGMALTSVGIARGIVKFTDIVLGPVKMVASAVKFAAELVLSIFSSILPNRWLANSYAFLNNLIYKINGVKNLKCKAEEQKIENEIDNNPLLIGVRDNEDIPPSTTLTTVQKVLNFFKNVAFGILTPIAKVGIFVGNFVFNLLLMPIDMYVKPFMSKGV